MSDIKELFKALELSDESKSIDLLDNDPSLVNVENEHSQTPFWIAACMGHTFVIKKMLEAPIVDVLDHQKRDSRNRSALDAAEAFHNKEIIDLLTPIFGSNEYAHAAEDENGSSMFNDWMLSITDIFIVRKELAYSAFGVIAAVFIATVFFLTSETFDRDNGGRMIADGASNFDISSSVRETLAGNKEGVMDLESLETALGSEGWTGFDITKTQSIDQFLGPQKKLWLNGAIH